MMQLPTASAIPGPAWRLLQGAGPRLYRLICRRLSPANPPWSCSQPGAFCQTPEMPLSRRGWGAAEAREEVPAVLFPGLQRSGERNSLPAANSLKQHSAPVQPQIQLLLQPEPELFPSYLRHS